MPRVSRKSSAHTPAVSAPGSRPRPPSPLSPHRISRQEEQDDLRSLNNRLASYIDMVQVLMRDKASLSEEISTIEETKTSEIISIKSNYNNEIGRLRKALDEIAIEKAKFEMESDKLEKENQYLKSRCKEKERANDNLSKELRNLQTQFTKVDVENNAAQAELSDLRPSIAKLEAKLSDAKTNLEDETLKRVDLHNQLQTSHESMRFENEVLQQQLNETRVRKQIEVSEIDGRISAEYEDRMAKSLDELRDGYDEKLRAHKEELVRNYEGKIKSLSEKLHEARTDGAGSLQELREFETKLNGLTSRNLELESANSTLQKRVTDLINNLDAAALKYRADMARKDAEVRNYEERFDELTKDYESLLETKIALDAEIATYNKLLSGEENRLGTSPEMMEGSRSLGSGQTPPGRGIKRKRTNIVEDVVTELVVESSSLGDIVIEPLQMDTKYIAIKNRSGQEINIGGWTLTNITDDQQEASYKFHRSTTLQNEEVCKIYSSDAAETHNPPLNLVMKRGGWTISDRNVTTISRKDNTEAARCITKKERSISSSVLSGYSRRRAAIEESQSSSCSIM